METATRSHIVSNPGICGGKPCVEGTRIRVQDIYVWYELQGKSADEIVSRFPQLSLADVHAALTYYWDHRELIQRQMSEADDLLIAMKRDHPSPLDAKLANQNGGDDPFPPR